MDIPPAALFAFLATITGVAISYVVVEMETAGEERGSSYSATQKLAMMAAIMAVMYGIVNAIVFSATWLYANIGESGSKTPYAGAAAHFGLQPGEEYPLALGSRFAGSSGRISSSSGLFYVHTEGAWSPATAVSLGFENSNGQSWILEIPMSRITFIKSENADNATMVVHLSGAGYGTGFTTIIDPGGCKLSVDFGWWLCPKGEATARYTASEAAERAGLVPIVAQAFQDGGSSATITLTPQQYDALLKDG